MILYLFMLPIMKLTVCQEFEIFHVIPVGVSLELKQSDCSKVVPFS
jgi:hypothetical protein